MDKGVDDGRDQLHIPDGGAVLGGRLLEPHTGLAGLGESGAWDTEDDADAVRDKGRADQYSQHIHKDDESKMPPLDGQEARCFHASSGEEDDIPGLLCLGFDVKRLDGCLEGSNVLEMNGHLCFSYASEQWEL